MINIKTIYKCFLVWDFEKEEHWLNQMSHNGWVLVSVGLFRYTFERCAPGEYIIRHEMRSYDYNYMSFMEETGAEYIGRVANWIYFRRKTELGQFDIFSDIDSKISHLNRIGKALAFGGFLNLGLGFINIINSYHTGLINLLASTVLMYALGRIHGKKEALEKDRNLYE